MEHPASATAPPIRFETHPGLKWVTFVNPMVPILDAYRDCWMGRGLTNPTGLLGQVAVTAGIDFGQVEVERNGDARPLPGGHQRSQLFQTGQIGLAGLIHDIRNQAHDFTSTTILPLARPVSR